MVHPCILLKYQGSEARDRWMLGRSGSQLINRVSEKRCVKGERAENDITGHLVTYSSHFMPSAWECALLDTYLLATPHTSLQTRFPLPLKSIRYCTPSSTPLTSITN